MKDPNEHAYQAYDKLPEKFKEFASRVYARLKGHEQQDARDEALKEFTRSGSKYHCYEDMPIELQAHIDRYAEIYHKDRVFFSLQLWRLVRDYCLTEKLCLEIAKWLNSQGHILTEGFDAAVKIISYYCGTEESTALLFIAEKRYADLRSEYSNIHFSFYEKYCPDPLKVPII